ASGTGTAANLTTSLAPPNGSAESSNDYVLMAYTLNNYNAVNPAPVITLPSGLTPILSSFQFDSGAQALAAVGGELVPAGTITGLAATANTSGAMTAQMVALQPCTPPPTPTPTPAPPTPTPTPFVPTPTPTPFVPTPTPTPTPTPIP